MSASSNPTFKPLLLRAIARLTATVQWGELDVLVVDLPPGTGDVGLTMAQKVPVSGAIVVCTPQNIALADAKKAMDMFERTNVRVLGVVENMSWLAGPQKLELFPRGDLDAYLDVKKIPKLAQIPFFPEVGVSGEAGVPILESHVDDELANVFNSLAREVSRQMIPSLGL